MENSIPHTLRMIYLTIKTELYTVRMSNLTERMVYLTLRIITHKRPYNLNKLAN